MAHLIPSDSWVPARPTLRRLLVTIFRTNSDFEALLIDHFEHVFQKISPAMDNTSKLNVLLWAIEPSLVWGKIKRYYKKEIENHAALLIEDPSEIEAAQRIRLLNQKLDQMYQDREVFRRHRIDTRNLDEDIRAVRRQLWRGLQPQEQDILDDRYVLIQELGKGGFGTVWLGVDRANKDQPQAVAIKILHSQYNSDRLVVEKFSRSAQIMENLYNKTRAIVGIIQKPAFDPILGLNYCVMEHLPNGTLSHAVLEKKIDRKGALRAVLDISRSLEVAHQHSIIHRDVKPGNILLDASWRGKLGDFDQSRDMNDSMPSSVGRHGTYGYAAPECVQGKKDIDHRADIYSLAMTTIFALTAQNPTLLAYATTAQTISQLEIDANFKNLLTKSTTLEPEDRLASVSELSDYLEGYLNERTLIYMEAEFPNDSDDEEQTMLNFDAAKIKQHSDVSDRFNERHISFFGSQAEFLLRLLTGEHAGHCLPLYAGSVIRIGRATSSSLRIIDDLVSKNHAEIVEIDHTVVIRDVGSRNGVFVNGTRVNHERRIGIGDKILIGNIIMELVSSTQPRR